jgi:hypothetical protein
MVCFHTASWAELDLNAAISQFISACSGPYISLDCNAEPEAFVWAGITLYPSPYASMPNHEFVSSIIAVTFDKLITPTNT